MGTFGTDSYVIKPRVVLPDFQEVLRGPAVVPDPALVSCMPGRHLPCCMIILSLDCFSTGSLLVELVVCVGGGLVAGDWFPG